MRKIAANYIFPVSSPPIRNGIIVLSEADEIIDIIDHKGKVKEYANVEFYNGILTPGFINIHCHLELSHLQNQIKSNQGLIRFVHEIRNRRNTGEDKQQAMRRADDFMFSEGIVAVGDISNSEDSFEIKRNSKIKYHTFIELFSPTGINVHKKIKEGNELLSKLRNFNLDGSISPHSFYSTSECLLELIKQESSIYSVHFMESPSEQQFLETRKGEFAQFFEDLNLSTADLVNFQPDLTKKILSLLPDSRSILFVHNTFIKESHITNLTHHLGNRLFWAVCPQSNIYIEGVLPKLENFINHHQQVTIGTDSLASNQKLSILTEMITLTRHFPSIPFHHILEWATLNGAKALQMDEELGSLTVGKRPGINLIENFDFENMCLTNDSRVRVMTT